MSFLRTILAKLFDPVFGEYIVKFRMLKAYSKESAITKDVLFPKGETSVDADRMQKLLKSGIIKCTESNKYWFDRKELYKIDEYSKKQIKTLLMSLAVAVIIYVYWLIVNMIYSA